MRKLKSTLSFVLILAMILSLSIAAFAEAEDDDPIAAAFGLDTNYISFTNDEVYPWALDTSGNAPILYSTNHAHQSKSTVTFTLQPGYGIILDWRVSSEGGYDQLTIDTSTHGGEKSGTATIINGSDEERDFDITYRKDDSVHHGTDTAYIYSIVLGRSDASYTVSSTDENVTFNPPAPHYFSNDVEVYYDGEMPEGKALIGWEINGVPIRGSSHSFRVGQDTTVEPIFVDHLPMVDGEYTISSEEELRRFSEIVYGGYSYSGEIVRLITSFSMEGGSFTPIGDRNNDSPFAGSFDGGGNTITGLTVKDAEYAALFAYIGGAAITDLNLRDVNISGDEAGGLVGYAAYGESANYASVNTLDVDYDFSIDRCSVSGLVSAEGGDAAGIIADADGTGSISNCEFSGLVWAENYASGIAGGCPSTEINNCVVKGTVSSYGYSCGIAQYAKEVTGCAVLLSGLYGSSENHAIGHSGGDAMLLAAEDNTGNYILNRLYQGNAGEYYDDDAASIDLDDCTAAFWSELGFTAANGWTLPAESASAYAYRQVRSANISFTTNSANTGVYRNDGLLLGNGSGSYSAAFGDTIVFKPDSGYTLISAGVPGISFPLGLANAAVITESCVLQPKTLFSNNHIWVYDGFYIISSEISSESEFWSAYSSEEDFSAAATDSNLTPLTGSYPGAILHVLDEDNLYIGGLDLGSGYILNGESQESVDIRGSGDSPLLKVKYVIISGESADFYLKELSATIGDITVNDELNIENTSLTADSVTIETDCCGVTIDDSTAVIGVLSGPEEMYDGSSVYVIDSVLVADKLDLNNLDLSVYNGSRVTVSGNVFSNYEVYIGGNYSTETYTNDNNDASFGAVLDVSGTITAQGIFIENGAILNATACTPRPVDEDDTHYYRKTLTGLIPNAEALFELPFCEIIARADADGKLVVWLPDVEDTEIIANYNNVLSYTSGSLTISADDTASIPMSFNSSDTEVTQVALAATVPSSISEGAALNITSITIDGKPFDWENDGEKIYCCLTDSLENKEPLTVSNGAYSVSGLSVGSYLVELFYEDAEAKAGGAVTYSVTVAKEQTPPPPISGGGDSSISITDPKNGDVTVSNTKPSNGDTVTITPKPDEGYELDKLTVTDGSGKTLPLTDNGNGTYSFTYGGSPVTIEAEFVPQGSALPFDDVKESHWFYDDVVYVWKAGLMIGTTDTKFSPDSEVTRAMVATVLWRIAGEPVPTAENPFSDLTKDWYKTAVIWAHEVGIVNGYGDGTFAPDKSITREELMAMFERYIIYTKVNYAVTQQYIIFADEADIDNYAKNAAQLLFKLGIVKGTGETPLTISPNATAKRSELAAMLHRLLELPKG